MITLRKHFLTFVLFVISSVSFSQTPAAANLKNKLHSHSLADSRQVDQLIDSAVRTARHDAKSGINLLQDAVILADKLNYREGKAASYLQLAKIYNRRHDYEKAEIYASDGSALANSWNLKALQKSFFLLISEIQYDKSQHVPDTTIREEVRDIKAAIKYKYYLKDTLDKSVEHAVSLQKDVADKENELVVFRVRNFLLGIGFVGLLVLIGFGFTWFNLRKVKMENKQLLTEQKLKRSQMNPHFIFNSIQNVRSLIHGKKEAEAVEYLNKFSKLTRQVLESSNENYISLREEIEMLQHYLSIQQLLYSNAFDFSISTTDNIDPDAYFLPPMLAQPFVENAIKHGLAGKKDGGFITVKFHLRDKRLIFEVKDNGSGFSASKQTENHKSMAMDITKERLSHYAKNRNFRFQAEDTKDENQQVTGARVLFEIPYIYEN
ncbi:Sensor histidine kinase YehU [compost metagenome]